MGDTVGVLTMTNNLSLFIVKIDEQEEKVHYRFSNEVVTRSSKLKTNTKGHYFIIRGQRYYLNEFMRVD